MKVDPNSPAFAMPSGAEPRTNETTHYNEGMSIRTYLAAKAMQGMYSNEEVRGACERLAGVMNESAHHYIAVSAVAMADALIAELNK